MESIFQIMVPLVGSPMRQLSAWLIRGAAGERNLLVDSGFGTAACEQTVRQALEKHGCALDETDLFLTNYHASHSGLSARLKTPKNRVYIRASEGAFANRLSTGEPSDEEERVLRLTGAPESVRQAVQNLPDFTYAVQKSVDFTPVNDGWRISVGKYYFEAVDLAGHTPGQLGLWEPMKRILIAGDHLMDRTTQICCREDGNDYLEIYLRNLRKVRSMQLAALLPAHGAPIEQVNARIDECIAYYMRSCEQLFQQLRVGEKNAWELTRHTGNAEEDLLAVKNTFAQAEHLRRMEKVIGMTDENGVRRYRCAGIQY